MKPNKKAIRITVAGAFWRAIVGIPLILAIAVAALAFSATIARAASREKILHTFIGSDGQGPNGSLVFDRTGNLYGTTSAGGAYGYGTVFKLNPGANGRWTQTVLHEFNLTDGANPEGTLIFDGVGNLYGTTSQGGAHFSNGTVFELSPGANGSWTETVLFSFSGSDGSQPFGGLSFDAKGNLYGTAWEGGNFSGNCRYGGCGVVFELSPGSNGNWTGKTIHIFDGSDGSGPFSSVIFDAAGNLYGTTAGLYSNYLGTVFRLTPAGNGHWTETVLHTFGGGGGTELYSGLTFDKAGNLYGTTWSGGAHFVGSAFKLTFQKSGKWTETVLHSFNGKDGSFAYAGMVFDTAGNLWGTTAGYGSDLGSIYELTPGLNGQWSFNLVRTFHNTQVNGGVIFDKAGNVYSTSLAGGTSGVCNNGCGLAFEVMP